MAREHEGLSNQRVHRVTRRKADAWDRMKILAFLAIIIGITLGTRINDPFAPISLAIAEFFATPIGAFLGIVFILEALRQLHYYMSEQWSEYHAFWQEKVFGGIERTTHRRFKPWTRFRVMRFFRWGIYILIYGFIADYFRPDINGPIDAIVSFPRVLADVLPFVFQILMTLFIIVGQFVAIFWFLSKGGMDVLLPEEIKTRFSDVWGQDHVLRHVKENIGFLEKPDEIEARGGYIPGGILLWGPPGTGKTLMAEAIAGETGKPFVFVDPGAFINMFMGVGILKVKSLYRKLRKLSLRHGGVIVFLDEADSLGNRGGGVATAATERIPHAGMAACHGFSYLSSASQSALLDLEPSFPGEPAPGRTIWDRIMMGGMGGGGAGTLQMLLTEMNGLTKPRGIWNKLRKALGFRPKPPPRYRILHILATNRPDVLDEAFMRPGRIDRVYKVGFPSKEGRLVTLQGYLDKVQHELTETEVLKLSGATPMYSGAKIKDLVNEALIIAVRDGREAITWPDIWKAKALKELGPPEDVEYINRERHAVAIHEASHAVTAHLLGAHRLIDMVTIEKHSGFLGMVKNLSQEERFTQWRSEFEVDIMVSLASLAGEKLFFDDDNSSGVSGDMANASRLAAWMEGAWGMGEGLVSYQNNRINASGQSDHPVSVTLAEQREAVERILAPLYVRVQELLESNRDKVLTLAAVLEDRKTISGDEVAEVMESKPGSWTTGDRRGWVTIDEEAAENRRARSLALLPSPITPSNGHEPESEQETED